MGPTQTLRRCFLTPALLAACGCATARPVAHVPEEYFQTVRIAAGEDSFVEHSLSKSVSAEPTPVVSPTDSSLDANETEGIARVSYSEPRDAPATTVPAATERGPQPLLTPSQDDDPSSDNDLAPIGMGGLSLDQVIASVYQTYPLLQGALYTRNVALGEQIAAAGEFDLKLKGASENGPTGFYQTYRQSIGVLQPLYGGGEVFAGYRIGRGDFQPWYLERQTNNGGEFKAGVGVPLLQNTDIDARRAGLWRAQYGRQLAEPEIQAQLIAFVQEAAYAYWAWVAAGANYRIADRVLHLATDRTDRIRDQVEAQLIDPPELTDNLRLVAERKAKLADAERKLDQTAAKLSLFLRGPQGRPVIPDRSQLLDFPEPQPISLDATLAEIEIALQQRPELSVLDYLRRQYEVEYAQAENLTLPELDAVVTGSQDVGQPTSKKRDKSQFEMEAALYLDVPIQRRKARGKMTALEGKLAQISAKRRMVADKISVDVQNARIALHAAYVQVLETRQAVAFAEDLAERERQNQEAGLSDLLKVTLREQYAAESATKAVEALMKYFDAQADLRAALGTDRLGL